MQQAIYTNVQPYTNVQANTHALSGHRIDETGETSATESQVKRFEKLRLVFCVLGNVLGGALLLSGMLMLPQLLVSLLGV
jgi:hypothetical protein